MDKLLELEALKKENKQLEQDLYIALNKIDKAIDYINELTELSDGIYTNYCDALSREKLLEILGDKE